MQADAPLRQKVNLESRVVNPGTFYLQFYVYLEGKGRTVVPGNLYLPLYIHIQSVQRGGVSTRLAKSRGCIKLKSLHIDVQGGFLNFWILKNLIKAL